MLAERRVTEDETPCLNAGSLFDNLSSFGDQVALIDGDQEVSYTDLLSVSDRIGALVRPRTLALVICANNSEAVFAYVGLTRAGAVPMLMPTTITEEQLSRIVSAFMPTYIFAPDSHIDMLPPATVLGQFGGSLLLYNTAAPDISIHDDLALMLSTSGSTGSLKFVRLSYRNLQANTDAIIEFLGIRPEDRAITTMPMSYTYGLSILNTHLVSGASLILSEDPMIGKSFWDSVKSNKATTLGGVPFVYEMLKKLRFGDMDLPSLRYITQAGGRLSPDLSSQFAEICSAKGIDFVTMYGQTEATARMSYVPPSRAVDKAGTIGVAIPGGELWIQDEDGNRVSAPDTPGELMFRGENVSLGYAEGVSDLARGDDRQGVLDTGDIGTIDSDGYFRIVGRKKRFLKIYGHRVNLDEIEQDLRDAGYDCACVGEDDALSVFVTTDNFEEVKSHILGTTTLNMRALNVQRIDAIPRNPAGKVNYPDLQRLVG